MSTEKNIRCGTVKYRDSDGRMIGTAIPITRTQPESSELISNRAIDKLFKCFLDDNPEVVEYFQKFSR